MALRVLLVDDNRLFLEAARDLLEREGVDVVGVASTSVETLRLVEQLQPNVVLVDIDLGAESGFDLASRLAAATDARIGLIPAYSEAAVADLTAGRPARGVGPEAARSPGTGSYPLGAQGD